MGAILDRGSLLYASLAVLAVSFFYGSGIAMGFYLPLLVLAAAYVPGLLLLGKLLAGMGGSVGAAFSRDYAPLLTCTAMAWAAANLAPACLAGRLPPRLFLALAAAACLYFLVLVFFAVRTVLGAENARAAAIAGLSWIPLLAAVFLWGPLRLLLAWLASPFFLFFAWYYLGGELGNLGAGLRRRQSFHRMLNTAAINLPKPSISLDWSTSSGARFPKPWRDSSRPWPSIGGTSARTSNWAASRAGRGAAGKRWSIFRWCSSRTTNTARAKSCASWARCTWRRGSSRTRGIS